MSNRVRTKRGKKDITITLMSLLAYEATGEARRLLKEQNLPDAKGYSDLEHKLGQMYMKAGDKVEIEKKLAEIHPHKNWLLRTLTPIVEPVSIQTTEEKKEVLSNCAGGSCENCPGKNSGFSGSGEPIVIKTENTLQIVAVVAIAALGLYYLKNK